MKKIHKKSSRLAAALIIGSLIAVIGAFIFGSQYAPLIGWDITALILLVTLWHDLHGHSTNDTAAIARRDDMNHSVLDVILVVASFASVIAVGFLLKSSGTSDTASLLQIAFGLISIVISWATVHSLYAVRYAAMYYRNIEGGVDFEGNERPRFSDFAYLAFTIGMTYQVSDTTLQTSEFRNIAIRHALLSFLFGTAIIATTINFIASLSQ